MNTGGDKGTLQEGNIKMDILYWYLSSFKAVIVVLVLKLVLYTRKRAKCSSVGRPSARHTSVGRMDSSINHCTVHVVATD